MVILNRSRSKTSRACSRSSSLSRPKSGCASSSRTSASATSRDLLGDLDLSTLTSRPRRQRGAVPRQPVQSVRVAHRGPRRRAVHRQQLHHLQQPLVRYGCLHAAGLRHRTEVCILVRTSSRLIIIIIVVIIIVIDLFIEKTQYITSTMNIRDECR